MFKLSICTWAHNAAAAVFSGRHGAVTQNKLKRPR